MSMLDSIQRRLQNIYHLCYTSTPPNDTGATMTVQMSPDNVRVFDDVPLIQTFGFSSAPPVGALCARFNLAGDCTGGVAIGSVHQASRPTGLTPGQSVMYDQIGSTFLFDNAGNATFTPKGGKLIIKGDMVIDGDVSMTGNFSMTGNLTVSGAISATGEVTAIAGATQVNLSTHLTAGVQTGTGESGAPVPNS
jgi:phage gp45-like